MQNADQNEGNQQQGQGQQNQQQNVEPPREREVLIIDTSQWEKKSEDSDYSEKRNK